jgi:hypothetical protein
VRTSESENALLSFPNDIPSDLFFFLVNYLHYPERYKLEGRDIAVVGKATLTPAFQVPDPSLEGEKVRLYVPESDNHFDVVYIALSSGETYENSIAKSKWRKVESRRMPQWVHEL